MKSALVATVVVDRESLGHHAPIDYGSLRIVAIGDKPITPWIAESMLEAFEEAPDHFVHTLPTEWTADLVAEKLIEAFSVDRRMARIKGPRELGAVHPQIEYSAEDREEWERQEIKLAPLADEIAAMETAFGWLDAVRESDWNAFDALRKWAIYKNWHISLRSIAKKAGMKESTLRLRYERALSSIVSRLNRLGTPVF